MLILLGISYFMLENLIIDLFQKFTEHRVKNRWLSFLLIAGFAGFIVYCNVTDFDLISNGSLSLKIIYSVIYLGFRWLIYMVSFKKCSLSIFFLYLFTLATNQAYTNFTGPLFPKNHLAYSFLIEAVILALIYVYIKIANKENLYRQMIKILPRKAYGILVVFLFIATISTMLAVDLVSGKAIIFILVVFALMLVLSLAVIKLGLSEAEKRAANLVLSKQVENQIHYYETINEIYGEFRSFRHDYQNHVLCLRSLIMEGKHEEALDYVGTMQELSAVGKNKFHSGNVIMDALLDDKNTDAQKVGATIIFSGIIPSEGISNADLCIIMANAIDNAIEACSKADLTADLAEENLKEMDQIKKSLNKQKGIQIQADVKQGYFYFKVSNPMFEELKYDDKHKILTTKEDQLNHGLGITNIMHTVEKYGGTTDIKAEKSMFTMEIQLKLKLE